MGCVPQLCFAAANQPTCQANSLLPCDCRQLPAELDGMYLRNGELLLLPLKLPTEPDVFGPLVAQLLLV